MIGQIAMSSFFQQVEVMILLAIVDKKSCKTDTKWEEGAKVRGKPPVKQSYQIIFNRVETTVQILTYHNA